MTLLFENSGRAWRVRFVVLLIWIFAAVMVWLAYSLLLGYGLAPGDGGVLRPLSQRLSVAAFVLVLGLLPLVGMLLYARRYLLRIVRRDDQLELIVLGFFAPFALRFPAGRIVQTRYFDGYFAARGLIVDAPWITLRVEGRWLPFIADMQARFANDRAILALSGKQSAAGRRLTVTVPKARQRRPGSS